jgi:hypothetical protein
MTLQTTEAQNLRESILRIIRHPTQKGRENLMLPTLAQLQRLDEFLVAANLIGQQALIAHDTVTAIQNGEILVAPGTDPELAITLDDLKESQ